MHVVFAHQNYPAQFGAFGAYLARRGWQVTFFTAAEEASPPPGCQMVKMLPHRDPTPGVHRFAATMEKAAINGQAFANAAITARRAGLMPDVVVAHSGWGSGTFAKAVWPEARFVAYVEWFYRYPPVDETEKPSTENLEDGRASALARNTPMMLDLAQAEMILCPTRFQADQFPPHEAARMWVMHDGVDTGAIAPDPGATMPVPDGALPAGAETISYATRGMEPHRGFPEFMEALARLQRTRPNLHAIIGGADRVAYGAQLPEGESWKQRMLDRLDLDHSRLHFTGLLGRRDYTRVLQATDLHVYLTVPFVVSWSLIEAMSAGAPLVASNTAPVREVLADGQTARLIDHRDVGALTEGIEALLSDRDAARRLGDAARAEAIRRYDAHWIWPARAAALETLIRT